MSPSTHTVNLVIIWLCGTTLFALVLTAYMRCAESCRPSLFKNSVLVGDFNIDFLSPLVNNYNMESMGVTPLRFTIVALD